MKIKRKIDSKLLVGIIIIIMSSTLNDLDYYEPYIILIGCWIVVYRIAYHIEKQTNKKN